MICSSLSLAVVPSTSIDLQKGQPTAMVVAPVATACTWPDTKAATVALLSSKRLTSAVGGAILVSSMSSMAPRVTLTVLPARSAGVFTASALGANTA